MRIFHGRVADRKKPYDVYTIRGVLRQIGPISDAYHRHNIKIITIFRHRRYNRPQSQFSNQKSIANEKHQPNADLCLAGITETL
jgi:hypothetical protein